MDKKVQITKLSDGVELHKITQPAPEDSLLKVTAKFPFKPVTDFTVTFCVIESDRYYEYNSAFREKLQTYASDFKDTGSHIGFSIATYRLEELGFEKDAEGKLTWPKVANVQITIKVQN
jgi:hypothetical protein